MYIFVFEILHRFIIEKVQGFFYDHEHGKKVVCEENQKFFKPKYKVFSCCTNFLIEAGIIGKKDQTFLNKCRRNRNKLAHNFVEVLVEQFADWNQEKKIDITVNIREIYEMRNLLNKIISQWTSKIELDTNPLIIERNINPATMIVSSPLVGFVDIGIESITE